MPRNEQSEALDFSLRVATRMRQLEKKFPDMAERLREFATQIESDVQKRGAPEL